jgi:phosphoglucomutase
VLPYVNDLRNAVDLDAIRAAGLAFAVDPLGGAGAGYWEPINSVYGLDIEVVGGKVDPTFSLMTIDHDGAIRMDCSSPSRHGRSGSGARRAGDPIPRTRPPRPLR